MDNFSVTWKHTCHMCQNPLDIIVSGPSCDRLFIKLIVYTELNPLNFKTNRSQFRFFGDEKKARRVCEHCRTTKICYTKELMKRECGIKPSKLQNQPTKNSAKTKFEIYSWFELMNQFFRRPDYEEYIPARQTYRIRYLDNLVIRDDEYEIFFIHY